MSSLLDRRLIVLTGKGGTGKTTLAASIGLLASQQGLRTIVVEMTGRGLIASMLDGDDPEPGVEIELGDGLWSVTIDQDRVMLEWLSKLTGRVSARMITSRATFQYFTAAAPGASELLSLIAVWELTQERRWRGRGRTYDLVVLDAPATGHALGLLAAPNTVRSIARVGPLAGQAERVCELLADPARSGYVAVAHAGELAVSETLELALALRSRTGRELDRVIVNGTLPARFDRREIDLLEQLNGEVPVAASAAAAARALHERARSQRNQLARLRRAGLPTLAVPFMFEDRLRRAQLQRIAERLARSL